VSWIDQVKGRKKLGLLLKRKLTYCSQNISIISWIAEELLAFKKDCATWSQSASRNLLRAAKTCGMPELSADGC
jgi:hypothetical protein